MPFSRRLLVGALVITVAGGLTACSDYGSQGGTPSASPTLAPAAQLAALARAGLAESYTGTYALRSSKASGAVVVRRIPTSYRLDVTVRGKPTAILVRNSNGTFSCQQPRKGKPRCLKVAAAGEGVPATFNAGQQVFSDYLSALAKNAAAYTVTLATGTPARGTVPAGTCFTVKPGASAAASGVASGTYCFSATGIPVKAAFASGSFDLRRLAAPPTRPLVPPARATPLPGTANKK